jgi:TolB-like protein/class 3 adenylate cyclase
MVQERPVRVKRRLSAILAADVAGYSRLMHQDEEATHTKLTAFLADSVSPAVSEHGGRIVKNTGDGFLAEFPSAVEAVRAAMQFQTRIKELTSAEKEDSRIAFRVGINVGDVIVEPHDVFGDGVNIAARLESIAEPGGICISSSAYDHVRGKVGTEFADLGEQHFKNIARPVRAYAAISDEVCPAKHAQGISPTRLGPPRLSIVVLPFANLSGDPEQDYFADGVTESLTTDLSRISGSFVIGRHTSFTYRNSGLDLKNIGRQLNVRYVLKGSVQRCGDRIRISAQLVHAETGNHLWAERFDKPVADLFEMQDEIVSRLANTLNTQLIVVEAERSARSLNQDAMDLYFQGRALVNKGPAPEHLFQARRFFERALAVDPRSVETLVGMAFVNLTVGADMLTDSRPALLSTAESYAIRALSLEPDNAFAHLFLGGVYLFTGRAAQGIAESERALALDRNLANAHGFVGHAKYLLGRAAETEGHVAEAFRLSPRDISAYWWMFTVGIAKLQLEADDQAVAWLRRSIDANRNYPLAHFALAGALGLLGEGNEARAAAEAGQLLLSSFTINRFRAGASSRAPMYLAGRERVCEGMRIAGVPEE